MPKSILFLTKDIMVEITVPSWLHIKPKLSRKAIKYLKQLDKNAHLRHDSKIAHCNGIAPALTGLRPVMLLLQHAPDGASTR